MTSRPPSTLLQKHAPSEDERREATDWQRKQWQTTAEATLFALARRDKLLAKRLCKVAVELTRQDDSLATFLAEWLRESPSPARRRRWTHSAHYVFLVEYFLLKQDNMPRPQLLDQLAERYDLKSPRSVENLIVDALKVVRLDDLPEFLRPAKKTTHRKRAAR